MAQLKMYWLKGTPVHDAVLPEGYSIVNYKSADEKMQWVECCKNGLVGDDADEKSFRRRALIIFFLPPMNGARVR